MCLDSAYHIMNISTIQSRKKKKEVYWTRYTMYHMYDDQISLCIIIFQNTVHGVHRKELSRHIMTEKKKKKEREQFQSDDI